MIGRAARATGTRACQCFMPCGAPTRKAARAGKSPVVPKSHMPPKLSWTPSRRSPAGGRCFVNPSTGISPERFGLEGNVR